MSQHHRRPWPEAEAASPGPATSLGSARAVFPRLDALAPACRLSVPTCHATGPWEPRLGRGPLAQPPTYIRLGPRGGGEPTADWGRNGQAAHARAATVAAHFRSFFRVSENGAPTHGLGGAGGAHRPPARANRRRSLASTRHDLCRAAFSSLS